MTDSNTPTKPGYSAGFSHWALAICGGLSLSVLITMGAFSYSRLIFAGPLEAYGPVGFLAAMISAVVIGLVVALGSSLAGIVAIPQDRIAPIYALIVAQILLRLPAGSDPALAALMALAVICATTLLTGLILIGLGKLKLGNLLRFIPYPVIGGFLAASGWLLVRGGLKLLTGGSSGSGLLEWFTSSPSVWNWLPGAVFAVLMAVAIKTFRHPLVAPLALASVLGAFYGVAHFAGTSMEELRLAGLLPVGIRPPWEVDLDLMMVTRAPWQLLLEQTGLVATILVTTFVSIVLSSSAIELMTNQEADLNHELSLTGWGNLAAGCLGGMVGFHSLSLSRFSIDLGIPGRKVPVMAALLCIAMIPAAPYLLPYVPNLIPGAILLMLGLLLLLDWLVEGWRKLSRTDYAVVVLILLAVALVGYLEGVVVGTIAAVILFIIKYSKISVVTSIADGRQLRSNVERPTWTLRTLEEEGQHTLVIRLRGFIFFGTATELITVIRDRVDAAGQPLLGYLLLDFQRVTGFDSSAAVTLTRIRGLAQRRGFKLALCSMSGRVVKELAAASIRFDDGTIHLFSDLDHALEWTEDRILQRAYPDIGRTDNSLRNQLLHSWPAPATVDRFLNLLKRVAFAPEDTLIRQGDPADNMLFIESGQVTACVEQASGRVLRLRRQGSGTVVGEIGLYLNIPRTASVVADTSGVAYRLSRDTLERITRDDPVLAAAFHQYVSFILAARNAFINATYRQIND